MNGIESKRANTNRSTIVQSLICRRLLIWYVFVGLCGSLVGCGKQNALVRLPVFGTVVRSNGEKLSGSIMFVPAEGHSGPAAVASIVDGKYQFDSTNGPTIGPHRVIIKRSIPRSTTFAFRGGTPTDEAKPISAAESKKAEWIQSINLKVTQTNQCDFKLDP